MLAWFLASYLRKKLAFAMLNGAILVQIPKE
jgi:hypothetical protein